MAGRASALKVARWLVAKSRTKDAVELLAAWAAQGENDAEGHELLAEALRIDPSARAAQQAFERMEGVQAGYQQELDEAIKRFPPAELDKLEKEVARPVFIRAQVGFNNNLKYKGLMFHIQTEDSGLDKPHIITHLFADGGRIIKSHKRSYASEVQRPDIPQYVRALMKGQHMEMAVMLREGTFDPVIEGKAIGGMATLETAPRTEVQKLATKKEATVEASASHKPAVPAAVAGRDKPRYKLTVTRSLVGGPQTYEPEDIEAIIGRHGVIELPGEKFCHPREAMIKWEGGRAWLHDMEEGNGVFLRIRKPVEVEVGDEFVVGDQLLAVERNPAPDDGPDRAPTYFYSSPKWPSAFRVVQIFAGGSKGACVVARGTTMQLGSVIGDFVFTGDPLVDDQHCLIEEQAGTIILSDLDSRTGVFVRIKGVQELVDGDEILVGRTRLRVAVRAA
jgi:hypothetical protein